MLKKSPSSSVRAFHFPPDNVAGQFRPFAGGRVRPDPPGGGEAGIDKIQVHRQNPANAFGRLEGVVGGKPGLAHAAGAGEDPDCVVRCQMAAPPCNPRFGT